MTLDRRALKLRAKETIKNSKPNIIPVAVAYLVLGIIIARLSARLMGLDISMDELSYYVNSMSEGNYDVAARLMSRNTPSPAAYLIDLLLSLVETIVGVGFIIFLLNTIRASEPCFGNLLDGFGFMWKIILLQFLMALFVALWSLLFFVPGIIAAYRYSQALYILADDPTKSPMQCLRESSQMMRGHKWELFMLQLSFFWWGLLNVLCGYFAQIWTLPYTATTYALYYERLAYGDREYQQADYIYE